ncbi:MAG: hypothetical protein ACRC57_05345 [Sarcina sp.]
MTKENIKKIISNPFTLSFLVIILILLYVIFNILTKPNEFNILLNTCTKINAINNKEITSSFTSNSFIDECNTNLSELQKIKLETENLNLSNELSKHKNFIISSLNTNIDLYKNLISFLENPSENIINKNNNIVQLKLELNKLFIESKNLDLNLTLNSNENYLLTNIFSYINELLKINRDSVLNSSQNETFKNNIKILYTQFTPLNENLLNIIKDLENENIETVNLLESVNSDIKVITKINEELHSLSIPSNYSELFYSMQSLFECYYISINSIRDYLISSISNNKDILSIQNNKDILSIQNIKINSENTNAQLFEFINILDNIN